MSESYWYLATPYSKYPAGLERAFVEACRNVGVLIKSGVKVYCPIAHTHPVAVHSGMDPLDHRIWLPADLPLMRAARGLIVCMMDGWRESFGVAEEVRIFGELGKPIAYMEPLTPPETVLARPGCAKK